MRYFDHDTGAASDEAIVALRHEQGGAAVDAYWCVLERIYRDQRPWDRARDGKAFRAMAWSLGVDAATLDRWLDAMVDLGLMEADGTGVMSPRAAKAIDEYCRKSARLSENGRRGGRPPASAGLDRDRPGPQPDGPEGNQGATDAEPAGTDGEPTGNQGETNAEPSANQAQSNPNRAESNSAEEVEGEVEVEEKGQDTLCGGAARAAPDPIPYGEIVGALNAAIGARYDPGGKATRALIRALWRKGYGLADFLAVIRGQCAQWAHDPKMCRYLRPKTLFGANFESYLQNARREEAALDGFEAYR